MLSVFLCSSRGQLPVANCQLSVVKVIGVVRAIGCLDSQVRAQTCLPWSVTHAEYVTSGSTWPEVTTCHEDSSLIGEPNTCLACPSLSHLFHPDWVRALHLFTCYPHAKAVATISVLALTLALASLLSHRLSKDEHTHTHTLAGNMFSASLPSDQIRQSESVKDVRHRRLQCASLNQEAFPLLPSLRMSQGNLDSCCSCCLQLA